MMTTFDPELDRRMDRRTFLLAGVALATGVASAQAKLDLIRIGGQVE
jgi:hypothetical protein